MLFLESYFFPYLSISPWALTRPVACCKHNVPKGPNSATQVIVQCLKFTVQIYGKFLLIAEKLTLSHSLKVFLQRQRYVDATRKMLQMDKHCSCRRQLSTTCTAYYWCTGRPTTCTCRGLTGRVQLSLQENITGSGRQVKKWENNVWSKLLITYRNIACNNPPSTLYSPLSVTLSQTHTVARKVSQKSTVLSCPCLSSQLCYYNA